MPIAWRPAHRSAASWAFEQMLPRWRWSIAKAFGSVTATDLMLASPGAGPQVELERRVLAARVVFLPPSCLTVIVGLNGRVSQLTAWK